MGHQTDIENRLGQTEPQVEVILVEQLGSRENPTIRVVIDHPDGVDHELCGRVTKDLADIREECNLEVSSPGVERPLTKPKHFKEHMGERIKRHLHLQSLQKLNSTVSRVTFASMSL